MPEHDMESTVDRMLRERGVEEPRKMPLHKGWGVTSGPALGDESQRNRVVYVFTIEELDRLLIRSDPVGAIETALRAMYDEGEMGDADFEVFLREQQTKAEVFMAAPGVE
jgi:hypothetical protein